MRPVMHLEECAYCAERAGVELDMPSWHSLPHWWQKLYCRNSRNWQQQAVLSILPSLIGEMAEIG